MKNPNHSELGFDSNEIRTLALSLLSDESLADDVAQQLWIENNRSASITPKDRRTWFRAVARNLSLNIRRDRARRLYREKQASRPELVYEDPAQATDRKLVREQLLTAVNELGEPYSSTVSEHYFEGLSVDEIASRTGRPTRTVRTHLQRGIQRLRARVKDDLIENRPLAIALLGSVQSESKKSAWGAHSQKPQTHLASKALPIAKVAAAVLITLGAVKLWKGTDDQASTPRSANELSQLSKPQSPSSSLARSEQTRAEASIPTEAGNLPSQSTPAKEWAAPFDIRTQDSSGKPVSGAQVWVGEPGLEQLVGTSSRSGAVVFDSQQEWSFTTLPQGSGSLDGYRLWASAPGLADSEIYLADPERLKGETLELSLQGVSVTVAGLVLDELQQPIANARIRTISRTDGIVWGRGFGTKKNDHFVFSKEDGSFRLDVTQTIHTILVEAPGFSPTWTSVDGRGLERVESEVRMGPGASLSGVVLGSDGKPAPNAKLKIQWLRHRFIEAVNLTSDSEGRFEAAFLVAGGALIEASSANESTREEILLDPENPTDTTLTLAGSKPVQVRLSDTQGEPIEGFRVDLVTLAGDWASLNRYTDSSGLVSVDGWPDAPVRIIVRASTDKIPSLVKMVTDKPSASVELVCPRFFQRVGKLVGEIPGENLLPTGGLSVQLTQVSSGIRVSPTPLKVGVFEFLSLPADRFDLWLVTPNSGRILLQTLDLDGQDLDLGLVPVPALGQLTIEWSMPEDTGISSRVRQVVTASNGDWSAHSLEEKLGAPTSSWSLLPGVYVVVANDSVGKQLEARFVTVRAGARVAIQIASLAPHLATLAFDAPENVESLWVEMHPSDDSLPTPLELASQAQLAEWVARQPPSVQHQATRTSGNRFHCAIPIEEHPDWVVSIRTSDGSGENWESRFYRSLQCPDDWNLWDGDWVLGTE